MTAEKKFKFLRPIFERSFWEILGESEFFSSVRHQVQGFCWLVRVPWAKFSLPALSSPAALISSTIPATFLPLFFLSLLKSVCSLSFVLLPTHSEVAVGILC